MSVDPETAKEEILSLKPGLVISELRLKRTSGTKLLKALKEAGAELGFINLSDTWSPGVMRNFFQAGGTDYLLKPPDVTKIGAALMRIE